MGARTKPPLSQRQIEILLAFYYGEVEYVLINRKWDHYMHVGKDISGRVHSLLKRRLIMYVGCYEFNTRVFLVTRNGLKELQKRGEA